MGQVHYLLPFSSLKQSWCECSHAIKTFLNFFPFHIAESQTNGQEQPKLFSADHCQIMSYKVWESSCITLHSGIEPLHFKKLNVNNVIWFGQINAAGHEILLGRSWWIVNTCTKCNFCTWSSPCLRMESCTVRSTLCWSMRRTRSWKVSLLCITSFLSSTSWEVSSHSSCSRVWITSLVVVTSFRPTTNIFSSVSLKSSSSLDSTGNQPKKLLRTDFVQM